MGSVGLSVRLSVYTPTPNRAGSRSLQKGDVVLNTDRLYQHGTIAMLVPGLFAGTQTVGELLQHGDTGIGTLTGLDGELIIQAGKVYQVNAQGKVREVQEDEKVPFLTFTINTTLQLVSFRGLIWPGFTKRLSSGCRPVIYLRRFV